MGSQISNIQKCNFEDIQNIIKRKERKSILINTMPNNYQDCLIHGTIKITDEEIIINDLYKNNKKDIIIIIYGLNCNDESIYKKYNQLYSLGFFNIYVYVGGMFEWLCLQDIYGSEYFKTTIEEFDILKYKSQESINIKKNLLTY